MIYKIQFEKLAPLVRKIARSEKTTKLKEIGVGTERL
jgi:hypothetical protein